MPSTACARAPAPLPVVFDDKALAMWIKALADAGADCRDKLDTIGRTVAGWPRGDRAQSDTATPPAR